MSSENTTAQGAQWLTMTQAAAELGVHKSTLLRLFDAANTPLLQLGRQYRVRREDFDRFVADHTIT